MYAVILCLGNLNPGITATDPVDQRVTAVICFFAVTALVSLIPVVILIVFLETAFPAALAAVIAVIVIIALAARDVIKLFGGENLDILICFEWGREGGDFFIGCVAAVLSREFHDPAGFGGRRESFLRGVRISHAKLGGFL